MPNEKYECTACGQIWEEDELAYEIYSGGACPECGCDDLIEVDA